MGAEQALLWDDQQVWHSTELEVTTEKPLSYASVLGCNARSCHPLSSFWKICCHALHVWGWQPHFEWSLGSLSFWILSTRIVQRVWDACFAKSTTGFQRSTIWYWRIQWSAKLLCWGDELNVLMEVLDIDVTICNHTAFLWEDNRSPSRQLGLALGKINSQHSPCWSWGFSLCERNFAERIIICHPQTPLHSSPSQSRIRYYYAQIQM